MAKPDFNRSITKKGTKWADAHAKSVGVIDDIAVEMLEYATEAMDKWAEKALKIFEDGVPVDTGNVQRSIDRTPVSMVGDYLVVEVGINPEKVADGDPRHRDLDYSLYPQFRGKSKGYAERIFAQVEGIEL